MAINQTWASANSATITTPSVAEQQNGFVCGPADPGLFNWLFRETTAAIRDLVTRMVAAETGVTNSKGASPTFTAGTIL